MARKGKRSMKKMGSGGSMPIDSPMKAGIKRKGKRSGKR